MKMDEMSESVPIDDNLQSCAASPKPTPGIVFWLQGVSLAWMLVECVVSFYAASVAHSTVLLAFGSDSLVELLSAAVVLFAFLPGFPLKKDRAARWAGILLFVLAGVVAVAAALSLLYSVQPATSWIGIGVSIAALIAMPTLAWLKRRTARTTGNRALAADAIQSATCAYLAAITLAGLAVNAMFHIHWIDSVAAIGVLPLLVVEGRNALRGDPCGCH
ncbi:MAG: cation transporter [Acidobacteriaceae bacterium]|jgi:divalent metal cation (Fe/Co/Zn/Cd) transporter